MPGLAHWRKRLSLSCSTTASASRASPIPCIAGVLTRRFDCGPPERRGDLVVNLLEELNATVVVARPNSTEGGKLSEPAQWMLDALCANAADLHWSRMQEHELLYADPHLSVLYLGDAAHGMVPTLGQGATQAIEDATVAGDIMAREWAAGRRDPRQWPHLIARERTDRLRFVMQLSLEATDTLLGTIDPVAGTLQKRRLEFQAKLRRLYCAMEWDCWRQPATWGPNLCEKGHSLT
jgi:2-polyprenyl-6-methoxyphenol hydroxylase-like FAD-dependent oxidoreductase